MQLCKFSSPSVGAFTSCFSCLWWKLLTVLGRGLLMRLSLPVRIPLIQITDTIKAPHPRMSCGGEQSVELSFVKIHIRYLEVDTTCSVPFFFDWLRWLWLFYKDQQISNDCLWQNIKQDKGTKIMKLLPLELTRWSFDITCCVKIDECGSKKKKSNSSVVLPSQAGEGAPEEGCGADEAQGPQL